MGRLEERLVRTVIVLGVLTALSVAVADLATPDTVDEVTLALSTAEPEEGPAANASVPTVCPNVDPRC